MLKIFITGNIRKAIKDKKEYLESQLDIKTIVQGRYLLFESEKDAYSEYIAEKVFTAISMGFELDTALSLSNQNFILETIDIKRAIKGSRYKDAVSRVIGSKGKIIKSLSELTECVILVRDNIIGIIGETINVSIAVHALNSIVRGAPYSHAVKFIQENKGKIYESEDFE